MATQDQQQNELVNFLVQNLEVGENSHTQTNNAQSHPHPSTTTSMNTNNNYNRNKHSKNSRKHQSASHSRDQHSGLTTEQLAQTDGTGIAYPQMNPQYLGYNGQDMQGRDREWQEYVQFMNLPVPVNNVPTDSNTPHTNSLPYVTDESSYNQDEAHFVQNFVQSPQFLPYLGYFQHPSFASQLSMFAPNQMYPFPHPALVPHQDNFQDPNAFSYAKVPQNNLHSTDSLESDDKGQNGILYAMGNLSMGEVPTDKSKVKQQKPKNAPRSWAEIANTPAPPVQQKPKPQPQQILTKQKPEEKKGNNTNNKQRGDNKTTEQKSTSSPAPAPSGINLEGVNPTNFNTNPSFARFFVIKSYSEDDIHKSIKYNVWASTDVGNKRLDTAFKESSAKGPIYLFYSVNASGQFCGMAQMLSAVDYGKKCDLWVQDKWNGQFQVKWIYIKDIPNNQLRHIRLENNDNKPVTNSRDTQEVLLEPGKEMLKIFATFKAKTSILDDFTFYDKRQEVMKEKKLQGGDVQNIESELPPTSRRLRNQRNNKNG